MLSKWLVVEHIYIYSYVQKKTLFHYIAHRCHNHHEQPTTKSKDISTPSIIP